MKIALIAGVAVFIAGVVLWRSLEKREWIDLDERDEWDERE